MNLLHSPANATPPSQIGNIHALLAEIAALLGKLAENGGSGFIDLKSLPLAPGEARQLHDILGRGEVTASIDALGPSEIIETRYPGVWRVLHRNAGGDITADLLEIAHIPEILKAHPDDVRTSRLRVLERLAGTQ
jgi:hydrogenase-1 operon protein HyaF